MGRGGKIGPIWRASPVHPELGSGWVIKLLVIIKSGQIWSGPIWSGPVWPDPAEFFLPSKGYLARPARFLRRAGLLKFWPKKSDPIWPGPVLAQPTVGPTQPARPARLLALGMGRES